VVDVDEETFGRLVEAALDSIPPELGRLMRNVAVVVEDEGSSPNLLGLYQGVPLTRRSSAYSGVPPDKITLFGGPLGRLYGQDEAVLQAQVRRVVLHELAHHFGISDERLVELDRY